MDVDDYRKQIELEILQIIENKLQSGQINADRAREIARYILNSLHPKMSLDQIYETVKSFDSHFPELIPVIVKVSSDYDTLIKKTVIDHVESLLKQRKISEANVLLKQATSNDVKLE